MNRRDDGSDLLRWHRLESLWDDARAVPPCDRHAFLDREVGDDPALRDELEQLLANADRAQDLLERLAPTLGRGAEDALGDMQLADVKIGLAGRYEVTREIGRGGSATVFLGRSPHDDRPVAIKVLHAGVASAIGPHRFQREIRLATRLSHPCILPLLDSGEIESTPERNGRLWYVTPFVPGGSLRQRLVSQHRLSLADAIGIAADVAAALDYAHDLGVIHRDVKPGNILLGETHSLLADFGIAYAIEAADQGRLTGTGFTPGTPPYMSPEQAAGVSPVDRRSDLFSLACVVHEMISGRPPARTPQQLTALVPGDALDRGLRRVLERALARQPAHRYRTCRELVDQLKGVAAVKASAWPAEHGRPPTTGRWEPPEVN